MSLSTSSSAASAASADWHDVIVIGAGLSGICASYYLKHHCPHVDFTILEARSRVGGTWDLFKYPGVRSDSDLYTFGFRFKPWSKPHGIALGPEIREYIEETAQEFDLVKKIQFNSKVVDADFDSSKREWILTVQTSAPHSSPTPSDGASIAPATPSLPVDHVVIREVRCRFLYLCSGYYRYASGFKPDFPEESSFEGTIIHPQHWPENIKIKDKRIIVIGSGATAVTLVPALADQGAKLVTMLQRSPTYMGVRPAQDPWFKILAFFLPLWIVVWILRLKWILFGIFSFYMCRTFPDAVKKNLKSLLVPLLPRGELDFNEHHCPTYNPWEQRFCLVPDGDLFRTLRAGTAQIVTDKIKRFTPTGIELSSGKELSADLIVSATGLVMEIGGGSTFRVDGKPIEYDQHLLYRGVMLSDVPNLAVFIGYTNASWTLKAELAAPRLCRMLNLMKQKGYTLAVARATAEVHAKATELLDFSSGYIQRAKRNLPRQSQHSSEVWKLPQNFIKDFFTMKQPIEDGTLHFE